MSDELERAVTSVLDAVPGADRDAVLEEFERYQTEFLMGPKAAVRSVITRIQRSTPGAVDDASTARPDQAPQPAKQVQSFAELVDGDRNLTLEAFVADHDLVERNVRGEMMTIGRGRLEDKPNEPRSKRTSIQYTDWGNHADVLRPGSVVRIEGASASSWQEQVRLEINRSARVTTLQASSEPIIDRSEPLTIEQASSIEGRVSIVARIVSNDPRTINTKDGRAIEVHSGRIADSTGMMTYTAWDGLDHSAGTLVKIRDAQVRRFRNLPDLNIGRTTIIEEYHDAAFPDLETLSDHSKVAIKGLKDGMRDVEIVAEIHQISERQVNVKGEKKTIHSGELIDPTGRCRFTIWSDAVSIEEGDLPLPVHIQGARVSSWQGIPDIAVDSMDNIQRLDTSPWESIDPEDHWVEAMLGDLVKGPSRQSVEVLGSIVSVGEDSGPILRCPECRRVLVDDACADHGTQDGIPDLRIRMVLDDGVAAMTALVNRAAAEALLEMDRDAVVSTIKESGREAWLSDLRDRWLARRARIRGRTRVDEMAGYLLADAVLFEGISDMSVETVRARWGI